LKMAENKVSLEDALRNVEALEELSIQDPQGPDIDAQSCSLVYQANLDANFEDRNAFVTGMAKYSEEAALQSRLHGMLDRGQQHAVMLYTWRSCSRAIPQPKSNEDPYKNEIYEKTIEIMKPEVDKLYSLMDFYKEAIETFCSEVKSLCRDAKKDDFVSEPYLLTLGKVINMFSILDSLKNMKTSIKNDWSACYQRAVQYLKTATDMARGQNLSLFIGTQGSIRNDLKAALGKIANYENLLCDIVNICLEMYEQKKYLSPVEKNMLVNVMAFSLFLLDNDKASVQAISIYKLDRAKKISISKLDKVFFDLQVMPLFGDMKMKPFDTYVKNSVHFNANKWPLSNSTTTSNQANLLYNLEKMREDHIKFACELSRHSPEVTSTLRSETDEDSKHLMEMSLRGLQLLSEWTSAVTEFYSWKLLHPTDNLHNKDCPPDDEVEEYERATRYNYSSAEKFALVEVISMIKGLQEHMADMEKVLSDGIRRCIFAQLQDFVQKDLREVIRRAVNKKQDICKMIVMSVREMCVEWSGGFPPVNDPAMQGQKDPKGGFNIEVPRRNASPSSTQLYMVRTMLESLICEKTGGKKMKLEAAQISTIEKFHKDSFFWDYLIDLTKSLKDCGDLSQLWYREFYLEMTMGKKIQFPIEMSFPWILTDHVLEKGAPTYIECVLYPFDLYNDSAFHALTVFKKQFLFDEVEAEVNLCFDQFVYKLSEQVYAYYKHLAGYISLDKDFRQHCQNLGTNIVSPPPNRYETILKQRHVQLLGRSIDLNRLICQRINNSLHKSLNLCISRFEAGDITGIVELEALIKVNRLTHKLLCKHLALDEFDDMFKKANHSVTAPYGRVMLHVFEELNYDFLPTYCYDGATNRFNKCNVDVAFVGEVQRDKARLEAAHYLWGNKPLNQANALIFDQYKHFIGPVHFKSMARLLGYQGIAVILDELLKVVKTLIQGNILELTKVLMATLKPNCKLGAYSMTSIGILGLTLANVVNVVEYSRTRTDLFHNLRELGNAILFCLKIEQALSQEEIRDLLHASPFQKVLPRPVFKEGEKPEARQKRLETRYAPLQIVPNIESVGTAKQADVAREADTLTKERLCCGLSIFEVFLQRIKGFLDDPTWIGNSNPREVVNIENCKEFHRLWSALQFIFCMDGWNYEVAHPDANRKMHYVIEKSNKILGEEKEKTEGEVKEKGKGQGNPGQDMAIVDITVEQIFGDGLVWAGIVMMALLGQQKRFECFDFCYHILRVQRINEIDENFKGIALKSLVDRTRRFQALNNQVFATVNKYIREG